MNLEKYRNQITDLIRGRSRQPFMLNGSEEHAAIIVERMFANANTEMRILSRRFNPTIYADDDVLAQVENFASNPDTKTSIIIEDISDESLSVHRLANLADALPNVEVRRLPVDVSEQVNFNYSVMDKRGYRFEDNKAKVNAIVRFDDPSFTEAAADYFDDLWEISNPIAIPA